VDRILAEPSRSNLVPRWQPGRAERDQELRVVRARGWAMTDEQLKDIGLSRGEAHTEYMRRLWD